MTKQNQLIRERTKAELRRRGTLCGEFISETITADAFDHSLERPDTFTNVCAIICRILHPFPSSKRRRPAVSK